MKQTLFPTLVALSLTGCAATSDLPTGYALTPGQPEGLLIVSLTLSGEPLEKISSFEYRIRALAPEEREAVIARPYFESVPQHARGASRTTARAGGGQEIVVKGPSSAEPLDLWEGVTAGRVASLRLIVLWASDSSYAQVPHVLKAFSLVFHLYCDLQKLLAVAHFQVP